MRTRRISITFKVDDHSTLTDAELKDVGGQIATLIDEHRDSVVLPLRSDEINVHWWDGDKMVRGPLRSQG